MKVLDRLGVVLRLGQGRDRARDLSALAARWTAADEMQPELARDLIRQGMVLTTQARGVGRGLAADALQLAYDAGRRDLALELLALMSLTPEEIRTLMEADDENPIPAASRR